MPWTEQPPRLDVGVVGTGRVGSVLGAALMRAGHRVKACSGVSDVSRLRAESLLPGVPVMSVEDTVKDRDLIVLTVPDDVLPELVNGLATTHAVSPGTFVMHASGRHGIKVFEPLTRQGMLPLAIHPVMTFTGTSVDVSRLSGCPFGITAPEELRAVAQALVMEIGGEPVWVPEEQRALYHAALAFGSNYLMTLVNQTIDLLNSAGIQNPELLARPLFNAALDNALRDSDRAATGPVVRGDVETVAAHIEVLRAHGGLVLDAYRALARLTADRAIASGQLSTQDAARLLDNLGADS